MNVSVIVVGEGSATGAGAYSIGDVVTLSAVPTSGATFSKFINGAVIITENPYVFTVSSNTNVTIDAVFIVTLEGYLKASVGFILPDATLMKIRLDRGILPSTDITLVSTQVKELAYADCLYYGATMPSTISGAKDSDNGFSHQDATATMSITDKRALRREAYVIYKKYGEKSPIATVSLVPLYGSKYDSNARY